MPEVKVDIEASLKVIETARIRPFAIENAAYIRAARDPIAGWEPTLKELRELREAIGHDKLHLFYALKNAEAKQINAETAACRSCRKEIESLRAHATAMEESANPYRERLDEANRHIPDPAWLLAVEQQKEDLTKARKALTWIATVNDTICARELPILRVDALEMQAHAARALAAITPTEKPK